MEGEATSSSVSKKSVDSISILVVDDDTTCLTIVAAILKKLKYQVVAVKHPSDALCTLRIKDHAFDVVVSDIHMPDMNGFELQQAIAQEFNLPVVLMSADDKEGIALKGLESGAAFFIVKPVSPDDLRNLWQFAAMKKKASIAHQVVVEESGTRNGNGNEEKNVSDDGGVSESSMINEETPNSKKDTKRNPHNKEASNDKKEEHYRRSSKKKAKIIWTNSLHNRFLEAIRCIGLERAVPKKILEVMNVPGLTRENVASHLQKYRIFLRRVSDASCKIQSSDTHKSFSPSFESSRTGSSSSLMFSRYNRLSYHNPASSNNVIGFRQSRLLSNTDSLIRPNIGTTNFMDRAYAKLAQNNNNNYAFSSSVHGHLSNMSLEDPPNFGNPLTRGSTAMNYDSVGNEVPSHQALGSCLNYTVSPMQTKSCPSRTTYVGYSLGDIKHGLDQSRFQMDKNKGLSSCIGGTSINLSGDADQTDIHNPNENVSMDDHHQLGQHLGTSFANSCVGRNEQLFDVVASHGMLQQSWNLPLVGPGEENGGEKNHESSAPFSPLFSLSELGVSSEEGGFDTTFADQVRIQNQAQQNEGESNASPGFYGDTSLWDSLVSSFDQAPNQQQCSQGLVNSQEFVTSSQLHKPALNPPPMEHQFSQSLTNSLGFGSSSQLNKTLQQSPTNERDDDEFLESLLVPFEEEDETLDGI